MLLASMRPVEIYGHAARMNDGKTLTVGQLIRAARERVGMGQNEMAKAVGVEGATAYRWESGRIIPGIERLTTIAGVLGVPVSELVPDDYDESEASKCDVAAPTVDDSADELMRLVEMAVAAARGGNEAKRAFNDAVMERARRLRSGR